MMRKKVLILSNISGMISSFLKNDIESYLEKGYDVYCACNNDYSSSKSSDFFSKYHITVFNINFPVRNLDSKRIISSYRSLKNILKKENFDVIHCHTPIVGAITRQCAAGYRKFGIKIIYTSHGFTFYKGNNDWKSLIFKIIEDFYSFTTDAIITICNEDYENAKRMHCKNVYKINGVGVNTERFQLSDFDRNAYREKLGLSPDDRLILSIGELNTNKNHQIVIRALSHIKDKKLNYLICGSELTEKGKRKELQQLADSLGVELYLLGFRNDIPEICNSCDIGAVPSKKEGLGLAGIEMLASGIPVVGSDRQGIKDYIIEGETGYLADPGSEESFALAIEKTFELLKDEKMKERCIKKSKEFDTAYSKKQIRQILDDIL